MRVRGARGSNRLVLADHQALRARSYSLGCGTCGQPTFGLTPT
jgi:hypothetical protein